MPGDPVLTVEAVTVAFDGPPVLREVSLSVAPGAVLALLGPSGAGKSTLLDVVAGFLAPVGGEVRVAGRLVASPHHLEPPERRDVAMVFQGYALWPHLSALDTVAYPLRRRGVRREAARAEAQAILERMQVGHLAHRRPGELSGGEQQRVGLARALARQPALYLFDEPTAHLDAHVRGVFLDELRVRRRETGAAAVYATHDAEEALAIADLVLLLDRGRVVQIGTPVQVYEQPADLWAARLTGPAAVLADPDAGGHLLVRPEWARLGEGPLRGRLRQVWFRGPHADYLVESDLGAVVVREAGPPVRRVGDDVDWRLLRTWPLPLGGEPSPHASSNVPTPE